MLAQAGRESGTSSGLAGEWIWIDALVAELPYRTPRPGMTRKSQDPASGLGLGTLAPPASRFLPQHGLGTSIGDKQPAGSRIAGLQ